LVMRTYSGFTEIRKKVIQYAYFEWCA
jgi:hypothetical protein